MEPKHEPSDPMKQDTDSQKGELLALLHGLEKFHPVLAYQPFTVETDNLGVKNFSTAKLGSNTVISRWLDTFARYSFTIIYRPGRELIPADTLSRLIYPDMDRENVNDEEDPVIAGELDEEEEEEVEPEGVDVCSVEGERQDWDLAQDQQEDPTIRWIVGKMKGEEQRGEKELSADADILDRLREKEELVIEEDVRGYEILMRKASMMNQVVVPQHRRTDIMKAAYKDHRGINHAIGIIQKRFFCPYMHVDTARYVNNCSICLEKKQVDLKDGEAIDRSVDQPWLKIYVDLVGPFFPHS